MSKKNKNNKTVVVVEPAAENITPAVDVTAPPVGVTVEAPPVVAIETQPIAAVTPAAPVAAVSLNYSRLIAQVEALWDYINANHFKGALKTRPIITIASRGNRSALAWYKHEIWTTDSGARSEINVSAESFSRTRQEVYTTMLHTMVYQHIAEQGLEGVNKVGYHNRNFEKAATAAGLKVIKSGMKGFAQTSLGDDAVVLADSFEGEIDLSVHRNIVKSNYKPMIMIPATQSAREFLKGESDKQKISMKELLDNIINSYITARATEVVVEPATQSAPPTEEVTQAATAAAL